MTLWPDELQRLPLPVRSRFSSASCTQAVLAASEFSVSRESLCAHVAFTSRLRESALTISLSPVEYSYSECCEESAKVACKTGHPTDTNVCCLPSSALPSFSSGLPSSKRTFTRMESLTRTA
jgi:hypothetical protein